MSNFDKERLLEHLKSAIEEINEIQNICKKCGSAEKALQDKSVFKPAIVQHFDVLFEKLMKFRYHGASQEMYATLSPHYIQTIREIRVTSSHDYGALQMDKMENAINDIFPNFKIELQRIVDNFNKFKIDTNNPLANIDREIQRILERRNIDDIRLDELRTIRNELIEYNNTNKDFAGFDSSNTSALNSIHNEMLGSVSQEVDTQKPDGDEPTPDSPTPNFPRR